MVSLVAAPDEHVAPVADGYVAAALRGAGELHGLAALVGWPRQVVRPQILVAISHLEAVLLFTHNPQGSELGEKTKETGERNELRQRDCLEAAPSPPAFGLASSSKDRLLEAEVASGPV